MKRFKRITASVLMILFVGSLVTYDNMYLTASSEALRPGSTGAEVTELQQRLVNWEYLPGEITGVYNEQTYLAIKSFQEDYGLKATGIADKDTLLAVGMSRMVESGHAYAQTRISDEQLLARAINGEARGEPYEGQVAVGAVILNRTRNSNFPKTIAGVIYQPGAFTAVSDGQINVAIAPKSTVIKAARDALNGWDPTNGCIYYWNPATATSKWIWSRKIMKKIGKHNFGI